MKNTSILVIALGLAFNTACQNQNSESVIEGVEETLSATDTIPGNYGSDLVLTDVVSPAEMIAEVEKDGNFEGKIAGEIKEVCTKKGCWLTMDLPNGESMRVTFKDYGFFVPTTSQGYPIVLEGVAIMTETDVDTQRHYAEDGGMSKEEVEKITEPKREITFEATGVVIKGKV
ncbi:MAG: DUF4920 domain-containing protein [Algoriphagus sp.]|uniref:DUF4920 domain-containing protein n=2 Tax=Algoriphagus sp. TaxID=1872435 RepID=UPI003296E237